MNVLIINETETISDPSTEQQAQKLYRDTEQSQQATFGSSSQSQIDKSNASTPNRNITFKFNKTKSSNPASQHGSVQTTPRKKIRKIKL